MTEPMTVEDVASTFEHCAGLLRKVEEAVTAHGLKTADGEKLPAAVVAKVHAGAYASKQLMMDADMVMWSHLKPRGQDEPT